MERIRRFIRELSEHQWLEYRELTEWDISYATYHLPGQYEHFGTYADGRDLQRFPSMQGTTYFFRRQLEIPAAWLDGRNRQNVHDGRNGAIGLAGHDEQHQRNGHNAHIGLIFESGGEGLLRINGASYQGLDRNHTFVTLRPERDGSVLDLEIELFDPIPEPEDPLNQQAVIQPPITSIRSSLVLVNRAVQSLMYTAVIARDSILLLPEQDFRRTRLMEALYQAMDQFVALSVAEIRDGGAIEHVEQELKERIREIGGNAEGTLHMVGQSHIDIAWLWPARETVRKVSRTFSTVDALMEEYPQYQYAQSQPQLFAYLKDNDPELYERVKARIKEGRWELVGGMWVEPDLNIPSGESLMRQMLYGQRFYQKEFGMTSDIEWLPDTFGYCASLPQILRHGGIRYFMTTKLGWNDTNVFPYDLFHWVGIDGTAMLSYLNHGVNENTLPKDIHDHWQSYREKAKHNEQMLLYGHGDGGGGVTREMLEYIDRAELMVGQPASRYSTAKEFFAGIAEAQPKLPEWHGDLYLELHRGTYTTHGRNKLNNRKAEILYREAELWNALGAQAMKPELRQEADQRLHDGWKLILLNQFHDIIPGSAITESYVTSMKEYAEVFEHGETVLGFGIQALAEMITTLPGHGNGGYDINPDTGAMASNGKPYIIFNSLGWSRSEVVAIELEESDTEGTPISTGVAAYDAQGHRLAVDVSSDDQGMRTVWVLVKNIPAFGYTTIWLEADRVTAGLDTDSVADEAAPAQDKQQDLAVWETEYYLVRFNDRGEIVSLFDKLASREIVKPGEAANRFHFFHDRPTLWDAWDIDERYEQQPAGEAELLEKRILWTGATKDVLRFRWSISQSVITQDVIFYHDNPRIDFKTHVDWNEAHKLLKVGFPIDVVTDKATYEIPFGALERTTHRNTSWEQAQYEVCGHRFADVSERGYGVSLLNDCKYGYDVQGSTIRLSLLRAPKWPDISADLGEHEFTYSLYPHQGDWQSAHTVRQASELNHASVVAAAEPKLGKLPAEHSFITFTGRHVIVDTVKPAEDGSGTVLRLYESSGGREDVELRWAQPAQDVWLSNALEEETERLKNDNGVIALSFAPYEIKTIKIKHSLLSISNNI
ncbi:alpha-mannosidase [Paenibacillus woosongensis]|uniref:alpha-mannosidase n=1 Tax=Paenibacillus woosongensis TaxID=307580 RepID=A0A7X2Z297_9BACL|nr:alpha-mannosidase [Paenibacillus woosongensis]MUG46277.1 alpha-mannosidase [Paenibacillus woosongensis]